MRACRQQTACCCWQPVGITRNNKVLHYLARSIKEEPEGVYMIQNRVIELALKKRFYTTKPRFSKNRQTKTKVLTW